MTNRIALFVGFFLVVALAVDIMMFDNEYLIFLGKKMFELIEWMAFWR